MAFPDDALAAHEKLVLNLHPHAWMVVKPIAGLVAALAVGVGGVAIDNVALRSLGGILLVVAAVWFAVAFFRWYTTFFVLTSDRVIYRAGMLSKQSIEIPLDRINTVLTRQSIFERMLRIGDLEIESASKDGSQLFDDMKRPGDVQKEIYVQMEQNENRKFDRIGRGVGGGGGGSIADQINQLAQLRAQGYITEGEFQAKKNELLNRM